MKFTTHSRLVVVLLLLVLFTASACEYLPNVVSGTQVPETTLVTPGETEASLPATSMPSPELDPVTLPPVTLDFFPQATNELTPNTSIAFTVRFSHPMNRESVEAAFYSEPELPGVWAWAEDYQEASYTVAGLATGAQYQVMLSNDALSLDGIPLNRPVSAYLQVRDNLLVTKVNPAQGNTQVRTDAHLRFTFNRPVVSDDCVGLSPSRHEGCAEPQLEIVPSVSGEGYWHSSSEYVFVPLKGWRADQAYTASLLAGLTAMDGAQLTTTFQNEFRTVIPQIVSISPADTSAGVALDTAIGIRFNTSMDSVTTGNNIYITSASGDVVMGQGSWSDGNAIFTFVPQAILQTGTTYLINVGSGARASTSMPLSNPQMTAFSTTPLPAILTTSLGDEVLDIGIDEPVRVPFAGLIAEASLDSHIQITSSLGLEPVFTVFDDESGVLTVNWKKSPQTEYCLILEPGIEDVYGHVIEQGMRSCYVSGDVPASLSFPYANNTIYLDATSESFVTVKILNVGAAEFELFELTPAQFSSGFVLEGESIRSWREEFDLEPNVESEVDIALRRLKGILPTGYYGLRWESTAGEGTITLVVVDAHMQMTLLADEALIWATDIRTTTPLSLTTVQLVNESGLLIAGGTTDEHGVARIPLPTNSATSAKITASIGGPDSQRFGVVQALRPLGAGSDSVGAGLSNTGLHVSLAWLDRDVYFPGDAVNVGGVVRNYADWHFSTPAASLRPFYEIRDANNAIHYRGELTLSTYGTFHETVYLKQALPAGRYSVDIMLHQSDVLPSSQKFFAVSESAVKRYTIELDVIQSRFYTGEDVSLTAHVLNCSQHDVPDIPVTWRLYAIETDRIAASGAGSTGPEGTMEIPISGASTANIEKPAQTWILEIEANDVGHGYGVIRIPVDIRASDVTLSMDAPAFVEGTGRRIGVSVTATDMQQLPVRDVPVIVRLLTCEQSQYIKGELQCESSSVVATQDDMPTDNQGIVDVSFTSPNAGYYMLQAEVVDDNGRASVLTVPIIVTDAAKIFTAPTIVVESGMLNPVTDKFTYEDGDVAKILIPTTDAGPFQVFVMLERGDVISTQLFSFDHANPIIQLPVIQGYAPFVNVGITVVRPWQEGDANPSLSYAHTVLEVGEGGSAVDLKITASPTPVAPGEQSTLSVNPVTQDGVSLNADITVSVLPGALYYGNQNRLPVLPEMLYEAVTWHVQTVISWNTSDSAISDSVPHFGTFGYSAWCQQNSVQDQSITITQPSTDGVSLSFIAPCNGNVYVRAMAISEQSLVGSTSLRLSEADALHISVDMPDRLVLGDRIEIPVHIHDPQQEFDTLTVNVASSGLLEPLGPVAQSVILVEGVGSVYFSMEVTSNVQTTDGLTITLETSKGDPIIRREYPIGVNTGIPVYSDGAGTRDSVANFSLPAELANTEILLDAGQSQERGFNLLIAPNWTAMLLQAQSLYGTYPDDFTFEQAAYILKQAALEEILAENSSLGIEISALRDPETNIKATLQSLYGQQLDNGGWSLNNQNTNTHMSVYVTYALVRAQYAGIAVEEARLSSALDYLRTYLVNAVNSESFADTVDWSHALALYTLSLSGETWPGQVSQALYRERSNFDVAGQAWLALAFGTVDEADPRVTSILASLKNGSLLTDINAPFDANAVILTAVSTLSTDDEAIQQRLEQVLSTWAEQNSVIYQDAGVIDAAAAWVRGQTHRDAEQTGLASNVLASVWLNGVVLNGEDGHYSASLPDGKNILAIEPGEQSVGYSYYLNTHTLLPGWPEAMPVTQSGAWISREYCQYNRDSSLSECEQVATIENGDIIEVRIKLVAASERAWIEVSDPIPGGFVSCSGTNHSLESLLSYTDSDALIGSNATWHVSPESAFRLVVDSLAPGTYLVRHYIRATQGGRFIAQPAVLSPLFRSTVLGQTESEMLTVATQSQPVNTGR